MIKEEVSIRDVIIAIIYGICPYIVFIHLKVICTQLRLFIYFYLYCFVEKGTWYKYCYIYFYLGLLTRISSTQSTVQSSNIAHIRILMVAREVLRVSHDKRHSKQLQHFPFKP